VRALGGVGEVQGEVESLMWEFEVRGGAWGRRVVECLPVEGERWRVEEKREGGMWEGREDLRELVVCSIDPPGWLPLFHFLSE
jgi:exosome complex exonuclease DIS3/RRP44